MRCCEEVPVLHSDNGAPMTSYMLKARLADLGMLMSHSRPRVSNDNPYPQSLFRIVKYCPEWWSKGFESLTAVREWMLAFKYAYNEQHLHSGIRFVTPAIATVELITNAWHTRKRFIKEQSAGILGAGLAISGTGKSPDR